MLTKIYRWFVSLYASLFDYMPVDLAIVRRYQDANHNNVGELYRYDTFQGIGSYKLIGVSLDSFPLDTCMLSLASQPSALDLAHDFLAPMAANTLRVGAAQPCDNDSVRDMIAGIPRRNIRVSIQNRFIEYVLDGKQTI